MRLSNFSALTFDCYGTLIDWETGICEAVQPWLERAGASATRDQVLAAFAGVKAPQQKATPDMPYPELLARVHIKIAENFGVGPDAGAFSRPAARN
jgi:2-haloacid dehalogenase/putative hydrolase of the HAD superfamily